MSEVEQTTLNLILSAAMQEFLEVCLPAEYCQNGRRDNGCVLWLL